MYHHARTDSSSSSSSTARSATPPSATSSDDSQTCDGLAWYQMPSVRLWKQRATEPTAIAQALGGSAQSTPRATPESDASGPSPAATHAFPQHFVFHSPLPPPAAPKAKKKPSRKSRTPPTDADEGDSDSARKGGPYHCPVRGCPQVLRGRDPKTWLRHLDSHWSHVYKRYTCPRCRTDFSRPESVMRHALTKAACHDVRTADIIERDACWLSPAYARFISPPPRLHPLFKVLQPVIDAAERDVNIAHPPWPILQPQIK